MLDKEMKKRKREKKKEGRKKKNFFRKLRWHSGLGRAHSWHSVLVLILLIVVEGRASMWPDGRDLSSSSAIHTRA